MKKLLIIIPSFYPNVENGGPILHLHELFKFLSNNRKILITVLTTNLNFIKQNSEVGEKKINNKYNIIYSKISFGKISFSLIFNILKKNKNYDYIYINGFFDIYTIVSLMFIKKKIYLSPRGQVMEDNIIRKNFIIKKIFIKLVSRLDYKINYIFNSKIEENKSKTFLKNISSSKILQNSASIKKFNARDNIFAKKIKKKKKIILTISRLSRRKNIDLILQAAKFLERKKEFVFHIYGPDFGEKEKLKKIIHENNSKNIKIYNAINFTSISNIIKNSYIFCLPSENENFGNVFLEAIYRFVPIIALNDSYWTYFIKKYSIGETVKKSANSIVRKIFKIDKNYTKYLKDNFIIVQDKHNLENTSKDLLKILNN